MNKLNPIIKINRRNAISQENSNSSINKSKKGVEDSDKNDQVSLSKASKIKASLKGKNSIVSDVRYELIKKYQEKLNSGNYVVKADELADKIVQKIRENKNRVVI